MIIKDWWYAVKVCMKYKIWWNPFCTMRYACINLDLWTQEVTISINPFYNTFLDSFMHEIGHAVRWRKIAGMCLNREEFDNKVSCILKEEYIAWKFSKRVLGKRFNKQRARDFFKTYWIVSAKKFGAVDATDRYYTYDRRIEK